jgi:hypothetical protein
LLEGLSQEQPIGALNAMESPAQAALAYRVKGKMTAGQLGRVVGLRAMETLTEKAMEAIDSLPAQEFAGEVIQAMDMPNESWSEADLDAMDAR